MIEIRLLVMIGKVRLSLVYARAYLCMLFIYKYNVNRNKKRKIKPTK